MKQQVRWSYKGLKAKNSTAPLLGLYLERKALANIGFRYDLDDISSQEARVYYIIDQEINKLQEQETKKASRKKGK